MASYTVPFRPNSAPAEDDATLASRVSSVHLSPRACTPHSSPPLHLGSMTQSPPSYLPSSAPQPSTHHANTPQTSTHHAGIPSNDLSYILHLDQQNRLYPPENTDPDLTPARLVNAFQNMTTHPAGEEVLVDSLLPWLLAACSKGEIEEFMQRFRGKLDWPGRRGKRERLGVDRQAGVRKAVKKSGGRRVQKGKDSEMGACMGEGKENEEFGL